MLTLTSRLLLSECGESMGPPRGAPGDIHQTSRLSIRTGSGSTGVD